MKSSGKLPADKREIKKQVNIKWNSHVFFQIGIIISVLLVFVIMQTPFVEKKSRTFADNGFYLEEPPIMDYVVDIERPDPIEIPKQPIKQPKPEPRITKAVNPNLIEVINASSTDIESDILSSDVAIPVYNRMDAPEGDPVPEPAVPRSMINVEHVPIYPGCEALGSNAEKIECMSSKINSFINRNFRKELLENLEQNQIHKIYVQFKIDANGFITDVRANSNNEIFKNEAQRVLSNLPAMKPGKQGDKNVDVLYTVPIIFKMQ